jgi:hypothetical protein
MPPSHLIIGAVLVTWLLEWVIAAAFMRRLTATDGLALLLINALTNPLANAAYNLAHTPFLAVEVVVLAAEIPLFRLLICPRWSTAVTLALLANSASALLSLLR